MLEDYLVENKQEQTTNTKIMEPQYLHKNAILAHQGELDFVYNEQKQSCVLLGNEDTEWQGTCKAGQVDVGCIEKALCENKQLTKQLTELQDSLKSSNQMSNDSTSIYNLELLKAVNLGIGTVVVFGLIISVLLIKPSPPTPST